jgi:predicted ATPase/DNA-binding winged helix-turn-helix (wHTH) protein
LRKSYEIGPFRLDADLGVLTRAGTPVALGARPVAVLAVLVEHAHEFLSKERLIDAAWPGVIVEESNLPVQVHAIRRVLAQAPGGERWIQTLAKRGYRFVGPVSVAADKDRNTYEDVRSNLPGRLASFVGRERDLVEIKRLLAGNRLITLVGAGGIGKTRLGLQIAAEVMSAYRNGAWFVDLGSLRDGALVATAVAQALGIEVRPREPLAAALCAHLRPLQLLLILDNCEHLLDACASLVEALLEGAAQTTILATSREPIRVAGEQVYPLEPLSLPQSGSRLDVVQRSEAVQLLVQRIREQLPDFELTVTRVPAVTELCIHLDGIPLALELAAARARSLSIEQINARLGQRFQLLTSGARTAVPRHQTLRATLDWSYDLLGEHERVVLRRLAVFAGSFTIEAGCAVASDGDIDEFAVVDILSQLVMRSLVTADTAGSATRHRLLETTRTYAQEKLAEAGEVRRVALRHAEYLCNVFARAPDDFLRLPDATLRQMYAAHVDDVRAALDSSFGSQGDSATGIRLAGNTGPLWGMLGLFTEGAHRLETALARVQTDTPAPDQAMLWRQLGRLVDETPARARPAFERAAQLYRAIGDRLGLAHALLHLGRACASLGEFGAGAAALGEANSLLRGDDLPWLRGLYFFNLGYSKSLQGDLVGARSDYEQAHRLFLEAGDEFTALAAQGNLANIAWACGDLEAADACFRQNLVELRASPMQTKRILGWTLASLAGVLTERERLDEALAFFRDGLPLVAEEGSAWRFGDSLALRAALAGKIGAAARLAGHVDAMFAAKQATRHPVDVRHRARVAAKLHEELSGAEVEAMLAEGARLTEADACRLALES